MPDQRLTTAGRMVQAYYWLTPVFLLASWRLGFDVRLPFLEAMPRVQLGYYVLLAACAGLVYWRPEVTTLVARAETMLSASLLIIATWSAYFTMITDAASPDANFTNPFTAESVASLTLSACIFIATLGAQEVEARRERGMVSG